MLFSSSVFLFAFLPIVLFLYYVPFRKNRTAQNVFLMLASLFFYAWGEPWFVLVMIGSIVLNWLSALLIDKFRTQKSKAKFFLILALAMNVGIIFIFKYLFFTVENLNVFFDITITIPNIVLPIGISFFTFQAISYVVDVYRGHGEVQKNFINVALYIALFPQLIAGPIVRYQTIADQINNRKESFEDFSAGFCRFIIGLAKKVILANTLALVADQAFTQSAGGEGTTVALAWIGVIAYAFQLFFDFAGYSDMAIGLGRMFGFRFLENFNYPYISKSMSEFWRRWHISLGSWFQDYVYFPMGGSRVSNKGRLIFNLFFVWFLTGVWHGASWTYVCWGIFCFIWVALEKMTGFQNKLKGWGHLYTMVVFVLGLVLVRSVTIGDSALYYGNLFGVGVTGLADSAILGILREYWFFFVMAILFSTPIAKVVAKKAQDKRAFQVIYPILLSGLFIITISYLVKGAYNPFIYFNF